jgi:hypothetical protein
MFFQSFSTFEAASSARSARRLIRTGNVEKEPTLRASVALIGREWRKIFSDVSVME